MTPKRKAGAGKAPKKSKHAGGRPPKPSEERLGTQLALRADDDTVERLDRLASRYRGLVSRASITRAALLWGLALLEKHPGMLARADSPDADAMQSWEILRRCWPGDGHLGGAERDVDGKAVVYLMPPESAPYVEDFERYEARADDFPSALRELARKVPPRYKLPDFGEGPRSRKPQKA
jgi:hypothetical protein